ncbi:MAG: cation:proton antiporter [Janthinobacterium lividum]
MSAPITAHIGAKMIFEAILLGGLVLSCWIGVIGMLRMREPMQGLHYISLPACLGSVLLTIAAFVETGNSNTAWKMLLICILLLSVNSVVTHAIARAFRTRQLGHWEPRPGDPVEFVRDRGAA